MKELSTLLLRPTLTITLHKNIIKRIQCEKREPQERVKKVLFSSITQKLG